MAQAAGGPPRMTEDERRRISAYIEAEFGIKMPAAKKGLLEGRLARRVKASGMATYGRYFDFVTRDPAGQDEFLRFQDLVSTHETSFFREPDHFRHLADTVVPAWVRAPGDRTFEVLSAACSTGEEAYTLAMVVDEALGRSGRRDLGFAVEGVDLSVHAVEAARRGVYSEARTRSIAPALKNRYLMVGKGPKRDLRRFIPELRAQTEFHQGNLLGDLALGRRAYDVIFCRNVLIYFEPDIQKKVLTALLARLKPGGRLFLGHSESMISLDLPVRPVHQAVFQAV